MKIWFLPIEEIPERYSSQWLKWFPKEFEKLGIYFEIINPQPLSNTIRQGSFLDIIGTNYYKTTQLQQVCLLFEEGRVKENDIFFLADGWFPGIESLAYIRDALGLKFKIFGIFHAGTYDPYDFLTQRGMRKWGKHLERSWIEMYDGSFVATEFHKELIFRGINYSETGSIELSLKDKIHVTGLPIYPEFVKPCDKENIIVFPHRLDPEKQPEMFQKVRSELVGWDFGWNIVKTKDLCKTKQQYYNMLNMAKISVSCALQETFGIAMQESVMCGCIPLVPDRLSYKELYPAVFRYTSYEDLKEKIIYFTKKETEKPWEIKLEVLKQQFIQRGAEAIPNMVKIMMEN